jgi:hypothetical protein
MITAYFALRQFVPSRIASELTNRVFVASGWSFGEAQAGAVPQMIDDPDWSG